MASPGDLAAERVAFKKGIDELNEGFGDGAGVEFVPLGWEDTLASTGRRVQSVINRDIDACDIFVLALFRRWGQPAPDSEYSSYTEEEFYRALLRFEATGIPEIFVFFKQVDDLSMADAGPQLAQVLRFRLQLDESRSVRSRIFDDTAAFLRELDQHLRAYAKGGLPPLEQVGLRTPLPLKLVEQVEQAEAEARQRAEAAESRAREEEDEKLAAYKRAEALEARAVEAEQALAVRSVKAAGEGSLEQARQLFATATMQTTSPDVVFLAAEMYWQTGPIDSAAELLERWVELGGAADHTEASALGVARLGVLHQIKGSLDRAEELHRRALAIYKRIRSKDGTSSQQNRLGQVAAARGDRAEAESLYRSALKMEEKQGKYSLASNQCTELALLAQARGEIAQAQEMHRRALEFLVPSGARGPSLDLVRIPVVVHVVYGTATEVISDEQVESQIVALNRDFRARNPDLATAPFPFKPLAGDTRIEFQLATVDYRGRPTTGITRTRTNRKNFDSTDGIKSRATGGADAWDPEHYLNMWVGTLTGGLMGYSQFPGGKKSTDGVVLCGIAFGTLGRAQAPFNLGRTTTHTVAHYLGVKHIWAPEGEVADIPAQTAPNFGTPTFPKISGNNGPFGDMFMNYMDYVDDAAMIMFTKHQALQMREVLSSSRILLGERSTAADVKTDERAV